MIQAPSMIHRIDCIHLSKSDRKIAEEYTRNTEMVAEIVCRAAENIRSVIALMIVSLGPDRDRRKGRTL